MSVSAEEFGARFPEFSSQGADALLAMLNQADRETDSSVWGDLHDDATYWLAAHLLAVRIREIGMFTGATPAKQYQVGSQQYVNIPFNVAGLTSTLYGQEFLRLEQSRLPSVIGFAV